jgi:hypothetical protein
MTSSQKRLEVKIQNKTNFAFNEQEEKLIRLMLDPGAQGSEVSTSCERLVRSLRKRRVTPEDFLENKGDLHLKRERLAQTNRANKLQAELHGLEVKHTKQLEHLAKIKPAPVTGRVHWTR